MNKEELLAAGYREYHGEEVDVYFNSEVCIHSGVCIKGNPTVFDLDRRPWIKADNDTVENVTSLIERCPSGALQYISKDKGAKK